MREKIFGWLMWLVVTAKRSDVQTYAKIAAIWTGVAAVWLPILAAYWRVAEWLTVEVLRVGQPYRRSVKFVLFAWLASLMVLMERVQKLVSAATDKLKEKDLLPYQEDFLKRMKQFVKGSRN